MSVKTDADIIRILNTVMAEAGLDGDATEIMESVRARGEYDMLRQLCAKVEKPEKEIVGTHDVLKAREEGGSLDELASRVSVRNQPYSFDYKNSIDLIRNALDNHEKITICGDYDVDGIMASSIMKTALEALGCDARIRIPLRFEEGFGLNPVIINEIDSGLIITVDNGIAALDAIDKAKEKGLTVLVTDHHEPARNENGDICLPKADCIIDPNADKYNKDCGYDFTDYCGAGVALKISEALLGKNHPVMDKLIAMAAVATIADVMPLHGANRNIVRRGIDMIAKGRGPIGLQQLFLANKIDPSEVPQGLPASMYITGDMIGYKIAPCINADSRMNGNADTAVACMMSKDVREAQELADKLIAFNSQRRTVTQQEEFEVRRIIAREKLKEFVGLPHTTCPFVIHLPDSGPGIIGLHAGRICEEERVPAIVINGTGDECKGSGRAPEGVNLKMMLDDPSVSIHMEKYGGHAGAAGLTVKESKIGALTEAVKKYCSEHEIKPLDTKTIYYDIAIDAQEIPAALQVLQKLSPFGEGNPEPVFKIENFEVEEARVLGQKGTLKLTGEYGDAIGFGMANGMAAEEVQETFGAGTDHEVVGRLSYNCFRGMMTPQIVFDHIDLEEVRERTEIEIAQCEEEENGLYSVSTQSEQSR